MEDGLLRPGRSFLDYGCGRGDDVRFVEEAGIGSSGWDPAHRNESQPQKADVVNLGYVANVIEDSAERAHTLRSAWGLAKDLLIVAARLDGPSTGSDEDGSFTSKGTFQKYFTQDELRGWIESELSMRVVAARPGVFYVFRDDLEAQRLIASRMRARVERPTVRQADALYEENRTTLELLEAFYADRGRLPRGPEALEFASLTETFGTLRQAWWVVRRATGEEAWERIQKVRMQDLLVNIALSTFGGRPKFGQLPNEMQGDVRAHLRSYKRACAFADKLLVLTGRQSALEYSVLRAEVGRLTRRGFTCPLHEIGDLPPLLRTYEGCGRVLAGEPFDVTDVTLGISESVVLYHVHHAASTSHGGLRGSVVVDLQAREVTFRRDATE
jgi:DNA phosphorothioation-associated putative methyltransferase